MRKFFVVLTLIFVFTCECFAEADEISNDSTSNTYKPKSTGTALIYSISGTVIPMVSGSIMAKVGDDDSALEKAGYTLSGTGMLLGPALGYFYGGEVVRGLTGIAIRLGLMGMATVVAAACPSWFTGDGDAYDWLILALMFATIGHTIYDIAVLPKHIRKHNEKMKKKKALLITPMLLTNRESANTYGLRLHCVF